MTEATGGGHPRRVPGSRPTLEALYRAHAGFVWRAVRHLGVPDEAIEDMVHEVFLVARRRLSDYEGRGSAMSWLYGIARGVAANHRRGRARAQRRLGAVPAEAEPPDLETTVARQHAVRLVDRFLATLDPRQREVFVLADVEDLAAPDIARALGVSVNVVYSRLRLARGHLRRFLTREGIDEAEAT